MTWPRACTGAALMLTLFMLPSQAAAQPAHGKPVPDGHDAVHRHHAAIFVGATTNLSADHTDPTVGADYEYRLPAWGNRLGLAAFGEFTFAAHDEWILGGGAVVHPGKGLKLFAGGGWLFVDEDHDNRHPLWRVGAGWEFHRGRITLTPTLFYDRIEGHGNLVYGVAVGTALTRRNSGGSSH